LGAIGALVAEIPVFAAPPLPQFLPPKTIGPTVISLDPKRPIIETSGEGIAHAWPDVMAVSFWAKSRAGNEAECSAMVASIAERVVAAEKAILGRGAVISTGETQVVPVFAAPFPSATPTATPAKLGWKFEARVRVSADSVRPMSALVEAGLAAGASDVKMSGFVFFGREQSGGGGSPGNIFTPGRVFPLPRPYELQFPYVILAVESEGKTADQCVRKGVPIAEHVAKVLADKLGSHGSSVIWGFDVRRIEPRPKYTTQLPTMAVPQGFSAVKSIVVKTRALEELSAILDAGYAAGAVGSNVGFSLTVDNRAHSDAISRGLKDAHDRAEAAARAVHMKLGKVYRVMIQTSFQPNYIYSPAVSDPRSITNVQIEADSPEHMPVAVRANVSVIYLLE
jgi:uncharacterized protein YggE